MWLRAQAPSLAHRTLTTESSRAEWRSCASRNRIAQPRQRGRELRARDRADRRARDLERDGSRLLRRDLRALGLPRMRQDPGPQPRGPRPQGPPARVALPRAWNRGRLMARRPTQDEVIRAQAHVVGLLNEAEAVLTGWVIGYDRDKIKEMTDGLYDLCDTDNVPALTR